MKNKLKTAIDLFNKYSIKHVWFSPIIIFTVVFFTYFLLSLQFSGPAYLSDEVGYLTKAATISGSSIDAATSWHAGYSILISPALLFLDGPHSEWLGVLFINAILWAASGVMLWFILKKSFLKKNDLSVLFASLATFLYPSWISMSGYAFSTSGFVFILMVALTLLIKSGLNSNRWLSAFAVASGFLYWIHPVGIVFSGLTTALLVHRAIISGRNERLRYFANAALVVAFVSSYNLIIKPALNKIMTADGFVGGDQYADFFHRLFTYALQSNTWVEMGFFLLGLSAYLIISSFGAIAQSIQIFSRLKKNSKMALNDPVFIAILITLLSLIGTILLGSFTNAGPRSSRADIWIYGRYTEMYILPLIGFSLLLKWDKKIIIRAAMFCLFAGMALSAFTDTSNTQFGNLNLINIQAFWPLVFSGVASYWRWLTIGSAGVLIIGLLARSNKIALVLVIPLLIMTLNIQNDWHSSILKNYSKESGLYSFIVANYKKGSCVGVMSSGKDKGERIKLYSFYLHDYNYQRILPSKWFTDCDGPYLTFYPEEMATIKGSVAVGREVETGLYVFEKDTDLSKIIGPEDKDSSFYLNLKDQKCVINGCFDWYASNPDIGYTAIGEYKDGYLYSNNNTGYLLYGPYAPLDKGKYKVTIIGRYIDKLSPQDVVKLRITSNKGVDKYLDVSLKGGEETYDFILGQNVSDLEVTLVSRHSNYEAASYSIKDN